LDSISDSEIAEVLLQLVQALKFEPFHWSALAEFLLHRALASPFVIGQRLFWLLRSDMHVQGVSDRYGLLLTQYLWRCSVHAEQLDQEYSVVQSILDVSNRLKEYAKEFGVSDVAIWKACKRLGLPRKKRRGDITKRRVTQHTGGGI
jgi:phosphatidylinositol-4,5-bisphosphate 3-kinase